MYFGADDTTEQLATILASQGAMGLDYFGYDDFGQDDSALEADVLAADMLFEADPTPANAQAKLQARRRLMAKRSTQPRAAASIVKNAAMQQLARQGAARAAGKVPFSTTGEDTTAVKTEILPIPPTVIAAGTTVTIPVRPIRSMQINSIIFPSLLTATAVCRLTSVQILGLEQLNGPGGVHCSGLTEVRTARILKGSTAQAGQDILVQINNTSAAPVTVEGWFEGPDLVRVT